MGLLEGLVLVGLYYAVGNIVEYFGGRGGGGGHSLSRYSNESGPIHREIWLMWGGVALLVLVMLQAGG